MRFSAYQHSGCCAEHFSHAAMTYKAARVVHEESSPHLADRGSRRLHFFSLRSFGRGSIIEICPKTDAADCPTNRDYYTAAFGDRAPAVFPITDSAAVSPNHNHPADGRNGKNRQAAVIVSLEREPERVRSEHRRRRREDAGGLHKVWGSRDAHDKERMANGVRSLAASPRQSQDRRFNPRPPREAGHQESADTA